MGAADFTLSGTVVDEGTGRPLGKIAVLIVHTPQSDRSEGCLTDSDGRFVFEHLAAGKYNLSAEGRGYYSQAFRQYDQYSTAIAVGTGLDSTHIVFPLEASGAISGTVLDEEGDPVQAAQLSLLYRGVVSGKLETTMRGNAVTGSPGTFHFAHLTPGTYFIAVQARPWYADGSAANPDLNVAYPVTFYDGTTDAAAASPIAVTPGGEAKIRIALQSVPAVHAEITGYEPQSEMGLSAMLQVTGPGGYPIFVNAGTMVTNDKVMIDGVAPGQYELQLNGWAQNPPRQVSLGSRAVDLTGNASVDMSTAPKTSVSGQLAFEGERPPGKVAIMLAEPDGGMLRGPVDTDGRFAIPEASLTAGEYRVILQNAAGFYLKSINAKGAKFAHGELEISEGGSIQLSLVAAKGMSAIAGVALQDGKPEAGAMVLLLPENPDRTDLIRRDQSDSDGTFTLLDAAPGRYTLVAIDDGRDLEYADPQVIAPYRSEGRSINVPIGNNSKVEVNVIKRERRRP